MDDAAFDGLVRRLEREAERRPRWYRARVLGFAVLGYAVLGVLLLVALATIGGIIAAVVFAHAWVLAIKGLKLIVALLALVWVVLRALWIRVPPPTGVRLRPADYPELFALIEQVRKAARVPALDQVLLVPDLNAAVAQVPRFGLFPWYRTYLLIGLRLMQATTPEELEAVLAHEMGHLSGAHGRLSSWIYRVRRTWLQVLQHVEQAGAPGRNVLWKFFRWYVPKFGAWSFVLARSNEYEADRASAALVGPQQAGDALVRVNLASVRLGQELWPEVLRSLRTMKLPPRDLHQRMAPALATVTEHPDAESWLRAGMQAYTDTADTHPSLADRLAALGAEPRVPPPIERTAAETLLGQRLLPLMQQLDIDWYNERAVSWNEEHTKLRLAQERLEALDRDPASLDLDRRLERARLVEQLADDPRQAIDAYEQVLALDADHLEARFAVARMLIEANDDRAPAAMEAAADGDPELERAGYQMLARYHDRRGESEAAERCLERAREANAVLEEAIRERQHLADDDELTHDVLDPDTREEIRQWVVDSNRVRRAWLVRKTTRHNTEQPMHVLMVQVRIGLARNRAARRQKMAEAVRLLFQHLPDCGHILVSAVNDRRKLRRKAEAVEGARIV